MPPQNQQLPQQPIHNPDPLNKKIHNVGRSVLLWAGFVILVALIAVLGINSLPGNERTLAYIYMAVVIVINALLILQGRKISAVASNPISALAAIKTALITSSILAGLAVLKLFLNPGAGIIFVVFTIVLVVYLAVAQSAIKKLAKRPVI